MLKALYTIYYWLIAVPLFVLSTILFSLLTMVGCFFFGKGVFAYYPGKWWSMVACALFLCSVKVYGKENLPERNKPLVIMANHQGAMDIFMIYARIGRPFRWVMKASLRKVPFMGRACATAGFIYVDEHNPASIKETLRSAGDVLAKGVSIAIFPEGHRTETGNMLRFKKGGFVMAQELGVPILPVTLEGSFDALRKGKWQIKPTRLTMTIHPLYTIDQSEPYPRNIVRAVSDVRSIIETPLKKDVPLNNE